MVSLQYIYQLMEEKPAERKKIENFWLNKMQLRGEDDQQLLYIELEHSNTLEMFDITVDFPTIKANQMFGLLYQNLGQFKDSLVQNFSGLTVTEQGSLIYRELIKKKYYSMQLRGKKRKINSSQLLIKQANKHLQRKMQELQGRLMTLINQKSAEMVNHHSQIVLRLNKRDEELDRQIGELKLRWADTHAEQINKHTISQDNLQALQDALILSVDRLTLVQECISGLTAKISQKTKQLKSSEEKQISSPPQSKNQLQVAAQNFRASEKLLKSIQEQGTHRYSSSIPKFFTDKSFLHFKTKSDHNKLVITCISDGQWVSFIRNTPIPSNAVSTYRIRQVKTKDRGILTGIATNAVFGQKSAYAKKQCLAYSSYSGTLYQNEGHRVTGKTVPEGRVIAVQVDPIKWQVRWSVGQQQLGLTTIPSVMRKKALHLVVIMYDKNDVVELF